MSDQNPIAIVFALKEEIRPLHRESRVLTRTLHKPTILEKAECHGVPVIFCQTGVGMAHAHEGAELLVKELSPRLIVSAGYAGGTSPELKSGDFLLGLPIVSETPCDRFETDNVSRELLSWLLKEEGFVHKSGPLMTCWKLAGKKTKEDVRQMGVYAVDMETAAIAAIALKNRIPFVSLRVIFDALSDELPFTEPFTEETNPIGFIFKNPKMFLQIPKFAQMNRRAQKNLSQVLARFIDCSLS